MSKEIKNQHLTDEQLFDLLDDNCTVEETTLYQSHLAQCHICQKLFGEYQTLDNQLSTLLMVPAPASFTETVINKWDITGPAKADWMYQRSSGFGWAVIGLTGTLIVLMSYYAFTMGMLAPIVKQTLSNISIDLSNLSDFWQQSWILNGILLINGILALMLLDKLLLKPFFERKRSSLS